MGFFPQQALSEGLFKKFNPMRSAVAKLSPMAKQAMYAASKKGLIVRGQWSDGNGNGCAFNRGGAEHGQSITDSASAAILFNMNRSDVEYFIRVWDNLEYNDYEANRYLIEAIEESGTHTPPRVTGRRVIRGYAYKGEATKFAEELESGELRVEDIPGCTEIAALLSFSA